MSNDPVKPHDALPGKGLLGWLGRQIGHVKQAIQADVTAPGSKTVYRDCNIQEQSLPDDPKVKLRRTVIDEVVVENPPRSLNKN